MKILGLIPARGGSKGVPGKNIKLLGGKPLIQYSIETALQANLISTVIVSTDDQEIADISHKLGAIVPGLRPTRFATDTSPTIDTVAYVLRECMKKGAKYDAVCLLQPTSPFRPSKLVDQAIEKFIENKADSLISVSPVPHQFNPHWIFEPDVDDRFLQLATSDKKIIPRRQDLPIAFYRNGSIYITRSTVILRDHSLYGERISYMKTQSNDVINIDTITDWEKAEQWLQGKLG